MPDVLKAQSNDIMGRIEQIAACGIPRELLILLSSGLFEAGKAAQRAGAPIGKLEDWCHECVLAGTTSVEQMIRFGMPSETMAELANALADIGRHAKPRGVEGEACRTRVRFRSCRAPCRAGRIGCQPLREVEAPAHLRVTALAR